jgi:holo-[acyl-carrier protein] synthase
MGIVGTGVDLVEVKRVERALTRLGTGTRFRQRVFTENEVTYCESRGRPRYQSYAARFAAKEAVMKALGTGWNRHVGWKEIEVVRQSGQTPTVVLHGKAAQFALRSGVARMHLSISHSESLAIAYVTAEN